MRGWRCPACRTCATTAGVSGRTCLTAPTCHGGTSARSCTSAARPRKHNGRRQHQREATVSGRRQTRLQPVAGEPGWSRSRLPRSPIAGKYRKAPTTTEAPAMHVERAGAEALPSLEDDESTAVVSRPVPNGVKPDRRAAGGPRWLTRGGRRHRRRHTRPRTCEPHPYHLADRASPCFVSEASGDPAPAAGRTPEADDATDPWNAPDWTEPVGTVHPAGSWPHAVGLPCGSRHGSRCGTASGVGAEILTATCTPAPRRDAPRHRRPDR